MHNLAHKEKYVSKVPSAKSFLTAKVNARGQPCNQAKSPFFRAFAQSSHMVYCDPVLQILLDPDPDPLVRGMDLDPVPSKSNKQKNFF
jgi:hypothetical protein